MLNLSDDQKMELEIMLIRLVGRDVITSDQHVAIMREVLGLPPWTEKDEQKEQEALDSLAPSPKEDAEMSAFLAKLDSETEHAS